MPHAEDPSSTVMATLLASEEPSIRWKTLVNVLGESRDSPAIKKLESEIANSPRVQTLLSSRNPQGRFTIKNPVGAKWQGAQWVLLLLADIGYPRGRKELLPLRDQAVELWLGDRYYNEVEVARKADAYKNRDGIPIMQGRVRVCASYQANALYFMIRLGIEDERIHDLVERLLHWQWPDGGWNCDKEPGAHVSTFVHTLPSMRALHLYSRTAAHLQAAKASQAAQRAADFFLRRKLFRRESDGGVVRAEFTKLHYPAYWHYDILFALKVFAEMDLIGDERCREAVELLRQKRLADGGWPAEAKYYRTSDRIALGNDYVDWGGTSTNRFNPWVTVDALSVLARAAG
jgi:hypothetical protein